MAPLFDGAPYRFTSETAGTAARKGNARSQASRRRNRTMAQLAKAIAEAAVTRLRPILMTSLTTILGLVVMALGRSEATSLIQPLAVTCIGGLLYATFMTLYLVPVMYDVFSKKELYQVAEEDLELSDK